MRLATIKWNDTEMAGIVAKNGILPIRALNAAKGTAWRTDMLSLIQEQQIPGLTAWYNAGGKEELESIPRTRWSMLPCTATRSGSSASG